MTDFRISSWSTYYVIHAESQRGFEWMQSHWRSRIDPPGERMTKVLSFLSTIINFWLKYEKPPYVIKIDPHLRDEIENARRILE